MHWVMATGLWSVTPNVSFFIVQGYYYKEAHCNSDQSFSKQTLVFSDEGVP